MITLLNLSMYSNFEVDSKSVIDSDVYNLLLFDRNYFHFLSSVWNFPVQCSLKGPFSSSFLSACKKGTFVLPLQQHFCIIVFLVFWFYLTFAVGDLFHEALEFVISSLFLFSLLRISVSKVSASYVSLSFYQLAQHTI